MEWLSNLLGMGGGATSPFGALGASTVGAGGAQPGLNAASQAFGSFNPSAPANAPSAGQPGGLPGIFGKFLNAQNGGTPPSAGTQPGVGLAGQLTPQQQNTALNQAMKLLQPQQIQTPQMMNLLSGPRG